PPLDDSSHAHDVLGAKARGGGVHGWSGGRVEDDLHGAPAVAEVHEDQAAVIPAPSNPAVQLHLSAGVGGTQRATVRRRQAAPSVPPSGAIASGKASQGTSRWSPLTRSRSRATCRLASSAFMITAHRAPDRSAVRILARRLRAL